VVALVAAELEEAGRRGTNYEL